MTSSTQPAAQEAFVRAGGSPAATLSLGSTVALVVGNALEFYDFIAYAFFAVYIGQAFFPATTPLSSLLLSVAVFGVGFIARPLGGWIIGAFADRAGRRPAMLLTILLMAVGTAGLAFTPPAETIGVAAPVIIVACRLIQGFALGGELGPVTAFLIESAPAHRRGLNTSWQLASQSLAGLTAGSLGLSLSLVLTQGQMQAWGWRVPFALGLLIVPLGIYLRGRMPETNPPQGTGQRGHAGTAVREPWGVMVLGILLVLGGTVSTYLGLYMTSYAITTLNMPRSHAAAASVAVGLATTVLAPLGGWLSDRIGRRPTMIWSRVAATVLTVPAFELLLAHPSTTMLVVVSGFLASLAAISGVASMTAMLEMLSRSTRARGMGIVYAIGVTVFGGTTQAIATWLIGVTGSPMAPAWYATAASVVTATAMLFVPETRNKVVLD